MHSYIFGHVSVLEVVVIVLYGLLIKASTVDTDELEHMLAQAVIDALNAAHLSIKEAAYFMKIDESQLRKQLRVEPSQHLSLFKLIHLPFAFWLSFSPALIALVYRKRLEEFAQTASDFKRGL